MDSQQLHDVVKNSVFDAAAALDITFPTWENNVDLNELNIRCIKRCILGQLYGSWGKTPYRRFPHMSGFNADSVGQLGARYEITDLYHQFWKKEINHRIRNAK